MSRLQEVRELFLQFEKEQAFTLEPKELYEPINYMMSIGGKKIRPLLVLASYELFAPNIEKALPVAYAVELFHAFTLVHDDIMDEAALRRGKLTVHQKYDTNIAILSGDVMEIIAVEYLLNLSDVEHQVPMVRHFLKVAREICEGQQLDMNFEKVGFVAVSDYLKMIEQKTAILLGLSLQLGAYMANKPQEAQSLYELGVNLGMAFQIKDDLLDTYGSEQIGKKVGGDILRAKKTFLVAKTLEKASVEDADLLTELLNDNALAEQNKISAVMELFDKYEVEKEAKALISKYEAEIKKRLSAYSEDSLLVDILTYLSGRAW